MAGRAALIAAAAGLLALAQGETPQSSPANPAKPAKAPHERIDLPSIAACGGCHLEVYREWSESLHARAWTNTNARQATRDFEMTGCRACHSPMPMLATGLEKRPAYRDFNQDDGVHCLSCHGRSDGVAASRTIPGAPCNPVRDAQFLSVDSCYPCHEPTHAAYSEYRTSDAFLLGIRCLDCHMPPRADGSGRSHAPRGGLNPEWVKKAIDATFEKTADGVKLTVRNRTGHKFPGEIPSRVFVIRSESESGERSYLTLRKPEKGSDAPDTRLAPNETRTIVLKASRVTLLFKPFPLLRDEEAFPLASWP